MTHFVRGYLPDISDDNVAGLVVYRILEVTPVSNTELTTTLAWGIDEIGDTRLPVLEAEEDDPALVLRHRGPVVNGVKVIGVKDMELRSHDCGWRRLHGGGVGERGHHRRF